MSSRFSAGTRARDGRERIDGPGGLGIDIKPHLRYFQVTHSTRCTRYNAPGTMGYLRAPMSTQFVGKGETK